MRTDRLELEFRNLKRKVQFDLKECVIKFCLIIAFFGVFTFLFYRQAILYNDSYVSDLHWHIRFAIDGGNYSFLYFIMGIIYRLTRSVFAIAVFESCLVILTFLLAEKCIRMHFRIGGGWSVWISAGMLFLCSIYLPLCYPYYYKWTLITQPWHNITYFGMRLFSIPVFFYTLNIIERYRKCFTWKDWLCLAIPQLLGAAIKPNFLVDYSLALLCILILDFVRDLFKKEINKASFLRYVCLGTTVFPAVIVLFYQMYILYGKGANAENGIAVVLMASRYLSQGMIKSIVGLLRDIAFPLLLTVYGYKRFSRKEKFVWLLFLVTLIQVIVLEETGPRADHLNFTWGIYDSTYLLFLYMVPKFIEMVKIAPWNQKNFKDKSFVLMGSCLLGAHLFFGLKYFLMLLSGTNFLF